MNFDVVSATETALFLTALVAMLLSFVAIGFAIENGRRVAFVASIVLALVSIAAFSIGQGVSNGRSVEALCQK